MDKECITCHKLKNIDDFNKHKSRGIQNQCRSCRAEYNRKHYRNNIEIYKNRNSESRKRLRREAQLFIWNYLLSHPCPCGESNPVVLEFDHLDPSKKSFPIGGSASHGKPIELLKEEISKCQVLCANCHRKKTAKQRNYYCLIKEFISLIL